ncbi:MAG: hypothetical protein M3R08_01255 [Bacteroidota bacterium]|nr:hypothetical protein [Bacteroidota bacterium]
MKSIAGLRPFLLVICSCVVFCGSLFAQAPAVQRSEIVVTVEGLTSEVRDGVKRDLKSNGDLELIYACVPAGILVFQARQGVTPERSRADLKPLLEHRIARNKISVATMDRNTAEERCAEARNR